MSDTNINLNNAPQQQGEYGNDTESVQTFSLMELIMFMLKKWYWFAISMFICLCAGFYYIASTPKVYKRQATILIKDSRKGSNDISAFSDIIGLSSRRNVDNELFVLQSRRLMVEVVEKLGLTTSYKTKPGLCEVDLYHSSPIAADVLDGAGVKGCSFDVQLKGGNKIAVTNFKAKDLKRRERREVIEASFGDTITTPVGRVVVNKTPFLIPEDYDDSTISVSKGSATAVANSYRNAIQSAVANKQSSIIVLSLNDNVPQRAEDILNSLIDAYNNDAVRDKQVIAETTAEFIDERLGIIGQELGAVDKEIEVFKKENNIFDLETEATRITAESSAFKTEGLSVENQIEVARYIRDYLSDDSRQFALIPATAAFSGASGSALNSQIEDYNLAVIRREKLLSDGAVNNPVVQDLDRNLSSVRNSIIAALDSHMNALGIQLQSIRKEEDKTNRRISSAPSQEKRYLSIARQQRIKEELYLYLLNKREENALTLAITENNARIVDSAFGPSRPIYPNTMLTLLGALVIGFIIPFGAIYLIALLDTTVKGRKDIERFLSVPYLGDIPIYEGTMGRGSIAVRENGRDSISEAFRILRTNMGFMNIHGNNIKVIQVTSSTPAAGKTFVSTNLAVTLAMSGKKVLLLDLDLRRRTLSKQLGHRHDPNGLTAYMTGMVDDVKQVISKRDLHDNLDMMYAGLQPPNPAEMLMSERLDKLFEQLRQEYDYIIIDSVPAMAVADAMIMNRLSDLCIYVIREGVSDRRQLPDIENLYRGHKLLNMCIVLNGSKYTKRGYGYGYGYDYGLSDDDDNKKTKGIGKILRYLLSKVRKQDKA